MPTGPPLDPRALPDRPSLRHLTLQARDLLKDGAAATLADAQFAIARAYGFSSWPALKLHVDSLEDVGRLKRALRDDRIPMMELLVAHGADVNARWSGFFPIIFAPCESLQPGALEWLLAHGASPNCADVEHGITRTALDYAIGTYSRTPRQAACIDLLIAAGATTKYALPPLLDLLRGQLRRFADRLDRDRSLVHRRFQEFDFGATAHRRLTLAGATLLHVAAEFGGLEAARLLLDLGADVNAAAAIDANGVGGQTPIFHAATQFDDYGLAVAELLIERGADLSVRVTIPGHYDRPDEFVSVTPLEYASLFPGDAPESATLALLTSRSSTP